MRSRVRFLFVTFLLAPLVMGCGGQPQAKPVDASLARSTLKETLENWKGGKKPEDLQTMMPKVVVQDPDWTLGYKLIGYELVGEGEARDANLYCSVRLNMENDEGETGEETVTYCVGTDPVLTVFRDIFH